MFNIGLVNRKFMKTAVTHLLAGGKKGIEAQRKDVEHVIGELSDEQLKLYIYGGEQSLSIAKEEYATRLALSATLRKHHDKQIAVNVSFK